MNSKVVEVVLVKSLIGSKKFQKSSVNGLGLKKIGQKVTINDTPENRGMIDKAKHLLEVNEEK
tara:strand:- start:2899 stop:3087 length:189 start_codon:yes stop_codon:yes gene_type:complete